MSVSISLHMEENTKVSHKLFDDFSTISFDEQDNIFFRNMEQIDNLLFELIELKQALYKKEKGDHGNV